MTDERLIKCHWGKTGGCFHDGRLAWPKLIKFFSKINTNFNLIIKRSNLMVKENSCFLCHGFIRENDFIQHPVLALVRPQI